MLTIAVRCCAASCCVLVCVQWADKFESKYPVVGRIVDSSQPNSGSTSATASTSTSTNGADGQTANPTTSYAPGI